MKTFILIAAILIGVVFFLAGLMKLLKTYSAPNEIAEWNSEKSIPFIRGIAWAEIIGAILFVVPYSIHFLSFLSIIAAFALTIIMIGAPISHLRLGEHKEAAFTTLLLILILLITFIRVFK